MKHVIAKIQLMILLATGALMISGCSFSSPLKGESSSSSAFIESGKAQGEEDQDTPDEAADGAGNSTEDKGTESTGETEDIFVHVCGCVKKPGLYRLASGARTQEAVDAAGGFTKKADQTAKNLAEILTDGIQVYIPSKEETAGAQPAGGAGSASDISQSSAGSGNAASGLVNINTASKNDLMTLPGIGESRAAAIIACREEQGSFASIEEIKNASGIGEGIFNQIKDMITVN